MKRTDVRDLQTLFQKGAGGLYASPDWKEKIRLAAAERKLAVPSDRLPRWGRRALLPAAMAAVLLLLVFVPTQPVNVPDANIVRPITAGDGDFETEAPPVQGMLTLVSGDVGVSAAIDAPKYRSLWATGDGSVFPLIGVYGKYYRMMTTPKSVNNGLLGQPLGTVTEYTADPSLSDGAGILSNVVPVDGAVYPVSGMDGTLVAAEVDGQMRVFQRVSFNGQALTSGESLGDTLQLSGQVVSISISDMGVVTDEAAIASLLDTLFANASYQSGSGMKAKQALYLELSNGITLQMTVKDGKLAACGTWACQEFLDAFAASIAQ